MAGDTGALVRLNTLSNIFISVYTGITYQTFRRWMLK